MQVSLTAEELMNRWQRQIGGRRPYRHVRTLAALGFLRKPNDKQEALVELRQLVAVVLFDESIGRAVPALRLAGFGAAQVPHGVAWGGPGNAKFHKDLRLAPAIGGWSLQVDASNVELLHLALQLHAEIHRVDRFTPKAARRQPQLPRLWAGFSPTDAESVEAKGPEFVQLCEKFSLAPEVMLEKFRREHQGLVCFPLDWVSDALPHSLAVYADLCETPRTQVFRLTEFPANLQGFQGAAAFDFFNSPQREQFTVRLQRLQKKRELRTNSHASGLDRMDEEPPTSALHVEQCGDSR